MAVPTSRVISRASASSTQHKLVHANPLLNRLGRLEMHTKFIIIGDDIVISSNGNYDFEWFKDSRETAMRYRSRDVARMTGLLPELVIDERDTAVFLLQHQRPLGAACRQRSSRPWRAPAGRCRRTHRGGPRARTAPASPTAVQRRWAAPIVGHGRWSDAGQLAARGVTPAELLDMAIEEQRRKLVRHSEHT
jgi:hypothetical protein